MAWVLASSCRTTYNVVYAVLRTMAGIVAKANGQSILICQCVVLTLTLLIPVRLSAFRRNFQRLFSGLTWSRYIPSWLVVFGSLDIFPMCHSSNRCDTRHDKSRSHLQCVQSSKPYTLPALSGLVVFPSWQCLYYHTQNQKSRKNLYIFEIARKALETLDKMIIRMMILIAIHYIGKRNSQNFNWKIHCFIVHASQCNEAERWDGQCNIVLCANGGNQQYTQYTLK